MTDKQISAAALEYFLAYRTEHSEGKRKKLFALIKQQIRARRETQEERREAA